MRGAHALAQLYTAQPSRAKTPHSADAVSSTSWSVTKKPFGNLVCSPGERAARVGDLWQTELSYGTVLRSLVSWLLEACGSCRNLKQ
jgi:hypothetical protein